MRHITLFCLMILSLFSFFPLHAQNPELNTNGISHLYWGFPDNSSWVSRNSWKIECGIGPICNDKHKNADFYAQDWNGTDDCDKSFYAPFDGTVLFAGRIENPDNSASLYGNQVIIQPYLNATFAFRIAHLNRIQVINQSTIKKGDILGDIGGTNQVDEAPYSCHAHIVLYRNLGAQDIINLRAGSNTNVISKAAPFCLDQAHRFENWIGGHGAGSTTQLLGDINGDQLDDAVVFFSGGGSWYVSRSTGSNFQPFTNWINGHGAGSDVQFLTDVNADGKADAVVFFKSVGHWYVAKSNGTSFQPYQLWISGFGTNSTKTLLADVNNDKRADAISFTNSNGSWQVALANTAGTGFNTPTTWTSGHGVNSTNQLIGDVTGDGKADAIAFFGNNGSWYVARANGNTFIPSTTPWISGHGAGSTRQFIARFDDDDKFDAVVFFNSIGGWYVSTSNGTSFNPFWSWTTGHGAGSSMQLMGNVDQPISETPRADAIVFFSSNGSWYVSRSCGL